LTRLSFSPWPLTSSAAWASGADAIANTNKKKNMTRKLLLILGVLVVGLGGCTTTGPDPQFLALLDALRSSNVQQVILQTPAPAGADGQAVDGAAADQSHQEFAARLRPRLNQLIGKPGGPVPARMIVTLRRLSVASGAGRALIGSDSAAALGVRLEAIKTKALIAAEDNVVAVERGLKGGGTIGVVIALAANATDAANNDLMDKLAGASVEQLYRWLTLGERVTAAAPTATPVFVYVPQPPPIAGGRPTPAPVTVPSPRPPVFTPPPMRR
jgi:hypothetical protein